MAAMVPVTAPAVSARVGPGGVEVLVGKISSDNVTVGISTTVAGLGTEVGGMSVEDMRVEGMRVCRADGMGGVTS